MAKPSTAPATARLREFYRAGQRIVAASGGRKALEGRKNAWGVNAKLQAKEKMSLFEISKARQLAREYTPAEFAELCQLGAAQGRPLSKWHVMTLLSIEKKGQRHKLAAMAATKGWSVRRLGAELVANRTRSRASGRGSKPQAGGPSFALEKTRRLAVEWLNWSELLLDRQQSKAVGDWATTADAARKLKAAAAAMQGVLNAVERIAGAE